MVINAAQKTVICEGAVFTVLKYKAFFVRSIWHACC